MKWWVRRAIDAALERTSRWVITTTADPHDVSAWLTRLHPVVAPTGLRRLGPAGDGGYLVPDDLEGLAAVFSPGVGGIVGFERDCAGLGMRVHLADGSVDGLPVVDDRLDFVPEFLGPLAAPGVLTLPDWVQRAEPDPDADLLLQMDIEGGEWTVLLSAPSDLLARFRIIVIEFHALDAVFERNSSPWIRATFDKLLATHACVHIHPNNCCGVRSHKGVEVPRVAEFTFLRRDRFPAGDVVFATEFPHPLDRDCTTEPTVLLSPSLRPSSSR